MNDPQESLREANQQLTLQKSITGEIEKQEVLRKRLLDGAKALGSSTRSTLDTLGVSVPTSAFSALTSLGGPVAKTAGLAADAGLALINEQVNRIDRSARINAQGIGDSNETLNAFKLPEQTVAEHAARMQAKLRELEARRGTFVDSGFSDVVRKSLRPYIPQGVLNYFGVDKLETSGEQADRENEEEIARTKIANAQAQKLANQRFESGTGGMELQRSRALIDNDYRAARALEEKISYEKEYQRVLAQAGNNEAGQALAREAANNKVYLERRERESAIGRSLVNVRSGASDIARAAAFASGDFSNGGAARLHQGISRLNHTVENGQRQWITHMPPPTHMRKPGQIR